MLCLAGAPGCVAGDEELASDAADMLAAAEDPGPQEVEAELHAAITALDAAIETVRKTIDETGREIARLEVEHAAKSAEIDRLVAQIEQRRRELEESWEKQRKMMLLGCMFGNCVPPSTALALMIRNDDRMQALERELEAARQRQSQVASEVSTYQSRKATLSERLGSLQRTEASIMALLHAKDEVPTEIERLAKRADRMTSLHDNLEKQEKTLREIRSLALSLLHTLDDALVAVAAGAKKADQLAEAAQKDFYRLLRVMTAGDPQAAASKWLDEMVAQKTKEILKKVGWDPNGFIESLVRQAFPDDPKGPAAQLLRQQLNASLGGTSGSGSRQTSETDALLRALLEALKKR